MAVGPNLVIWRPDIFRGIISALAWSDGGFERRRGVVFSLSILEQDRPNAL